MSGVIDQLAAHNRRLLDLETLEMLPIVARYTATTFNVTSGIVTRVNYDTLDVDTWSAVTTGASWVFTTPIGGHYWVQAALLLATSTGWVKGEVFYLKMLVNGADVAYLQYQNDLDSAGVGINAGAKGTTLVYLAKGDTLAVNVYQASGGALALVASPLYNYISIAKVNP